MPKATKDTSKQSKLKEVKKQPTVKKAATKKSTAKSSTKKTTAKSATKKASTTKRKKITKQDFLEYYDLPYRYNQTSVKVLAQTPKTLFVYWDISDTDRLAFTRKYGDDFFSKTKPILIVHNETMNYSFEIEINDFANSWYIGVNDPDCKYVIELGRRPNQYQSNIKEDYIYITSSNKMDSPNDHILFEKFNPNVSYKNVKTGKTFTKNISNFKNMQEIYGIYDLYKEIYKNELFDEIIDGNLSNSSSLSSSKFK